MSILKPATDKCDLTCFTELATERHPTAMTRQWCVCALLPEEAKQI